MPDFKVVERTSDAEHDPKFGWSYFVRLEGVDAGAKISHKKPEEPYKPGDIIEGYQLEQKTSVAGNKYYLLKREKAQNGNARGDLSPEAQARIDATGRVKGRYKAYELAIARAAISGVKPTHDLLCAAAKQIEEFCESAR